MPAIEFEVWCSCGNGLCGQCIETRGGITVEPCEKCIETARGEGKDEGYEEGYNDRDKEG